MDQMVQGVLITFFRDGVFAGHGTNWVGGHAYIVGHTHGRQR